MRPRAVLALFAAGLALALYGAFLRSGFLLLLDYAVGPHPNLSLTLWGFEFGSPSGVPTNVALFGLFRVIGWGAVRLVPLLLAALLCAWAFSRWLPDMRLAALGATLLFLVNPFVYERILAGHIGLLLGYALLPLLFSILLRARSCGLARSAIPAGLLVAILIALSPHFIFVAGVAILAAVVSCFAYRDRFSVLVRIAAAGLVAAILSVYWLIPSVGALGRLERVTALDLELFRTRSDSLWGLLPNVAGLYGFWRPGWPLPKDGLSGWPFFLLALLLVIGFGLWQGIRSQKWRSTSVALALSGVAGFFLALGDQGPTGSVFLWMFEHVPGFRIMREPQKFLALLALAYAFFYGLGSEWMVKSTRSQWGRRVVIVTLLALPMVYTYKMFWGFNGYVRPSHYPSSWAEADQLMGEGKEKALSLPWHLYMAFPWTQNRVVANPMGSYFRREMIIGDNIELGPLRTQSANPRSHYLEFLYSKGTETKDFGNLVAPLGIKYVVVAKEEDWRAYDWLFLQRDLRVVSEWDDLALFENTVDVPIVYAPKQSVTVEDWGDVVGLASQVRLVDYAIEVRHPGPGPVEIPAVVPSTEPFDPVRFESSKPVRYEIESDSSAPYLVLSEPFHEKWAYRGRFARRNLGVTNLFVSGSGPGTDIFFTRWILVRTGYLISGTTFLGLIGWLLYAWVRRGRTNGLTVQPQMRRTSTSVSGMPD